ncbi:hypothetical protein ACIGNX_34535 [Actinosynnema sp. NPDC053489]|uniref:hypothetical protein n=1 Tax=Actinosynnema sp. NPDC053489 TaxID=3363916 RepID=UPI0037C54E67
MRMPTDPLLCGDVLDEGTVVGFAYIPAGRPKPSCDRLLLSGDGSPVEPPARVVPETAQAAQHLAVQPVDRLSQDLVIAAADLDAALPQSVHETLARPGTPWGAVAAALINVVREQRHGLWLSGGFTRDVLGGAADRVNDLDLAGTAPPGRFTSLTRHVRKRTGTEFRPKVSKDTLVCSAVESHDGERLYEYRTLKLPGYSFPASGSDLDTDAYCRDFTVNSLYYDPVADTVIDPTGRGRDDLSAQPRRLVSLIRSEDAVDWAHIVLRAVKFVLRWGDTDLDKVRDRLAALPDNPWVNLSEQAWERLRRGHAKTFTDVAVSELDRISESLGIAATTLFRQIEGVRP